MNQFVKMFYELRHGRAWFTYAENPVVGLCALIAQVPVSVLLGILVGLIFSNTPQKFHGYLYMFVNDVITISIIMLFWGLVDYIIFKKHSKRLRDYL